MPAFDRLSINQVTLREQWSLAQAIEGFSRHGIHAIAVWRDKLAELGVDEGARMLRDHAMVVTGFCIAGLQTTRDKTAFQERLDDNRRVIEEAATIGAKAIIFVAGGLEDGEKDLAGAKMRCKEALVALLPEAKAAGMTLAVEPLHPMLCASRSVLASLAEANDWCDEIAAGRNSAWRSTSITCGGIRTWHGKSSVPAPASPPITSTTGSMTPGTSASTAA